MEPDASTGQKKPAKRTRGKRPARAQRDAEVDPQIRAENEDDDGYDPYSDRAIRPEPLFERDPWE